MNDWERGRLCATVCMATCRALIDRYGLRDDRCRLSTAKAPRRNAASHERRDQQKPRIFDPNFITHSTLL